MLKIDSKKGAYEFYGDTIDIISDIAFALSNVVDFMTATQMVQGNWDDNLDFTLNAIRHAVGDAHEVDK